jgi:hypothetical protein
VPLLWIELKAAASFFPGGMWAQRSGHLPGTFEACAPVPSVPVSRLVMHQVAGGNTGIVVEPRWCRGVVLQEKEQCGQ